MKKTNGSGDVGGGSNQKKKKFFIGALPHTHILSNVQRQMTKNSDSDMNDADLIFRYEKLLTGRRKQRENEKPTDMTKMCVQHDPLASISTTRKSSDVVVSWVTLKRFHRMVSRLKMNRGEKLQPTHTKSNRSFGRSHLYIQRRAKSKSKTDIKLTANAGTKPYQQPIFQKNQSQHHEDVHNAMFSGTSDHTKDRESIWKLETNDIRIPLWISRHRLCRVQLELLIVHQARLMKRLMVRTERQSCMLIYMQLNQVLLGRRRCHEPHTELRQYVLDHTQHDDEDDTGHKLTNTSGTGTAETKVENKVTKVHMLPNDPAFPWFDLLRFFNKHCLSRCGCSKEGIFSLEALIVISEQLVREKIESLDDTTIQGFSDTIRFIEIVEGFCTTASSTPNTSEQPTTHTLTPPTKTHKRSYSRIPSTKLRQHIFIESVIEHFRSKDGVVDNEANTSTSPHQVTRERKGSDKIDIVKLSKLRAEVQRMKIQGVRQALLVEDEVKDGKVATVDLFLTKSTSTKNQVESRNELHLVNESVWKWQGSPCTLICRHCVIFDSTYAPKQSHLTLNFIDPQLRGIKPTTQQLHQKAAAAAVPPSSPTARRAFKDKQKADAKCDIKAKLKLAVLNSMCSIGCSTECLEVKPMLTISEIKTLATTFVNKKRQLIYDHKHCSNNDTDTANQNDTDDTDITNHNDTDTDHKDHSHPE